MIVDEVKYEIMVSPCHAMKTCEDVDVEFHVFFTSALNVVRFTLQALLPSG
jgi:hypothetical protein